MAPDNSIEEKIMPLLLPILEAEGLELFELEHKKRGRQWFFRIFLHRPGGPVTLDDCQKVSQALDLKMEVENLFSENAVLEVSSVGLDRPLKRQKDFQHFLGENVRVKTYQPVAEKKNFLGTISACDEKVVTLCQEDGTLVVIPYEIIAKARLEIPF